MNDHGYVLHFLRYDYMHLNRIPFKLSSFNWTVQSLLSGRRLQTATAAITFGCT